jgi:hypothetical protein
MHKNLFLSVDLKLYYKELKKSIPPEVKSIINDIISNFTIESYVDSIDEIIELKNIMDKYTDSQRITIANEYNHFFDKFTSINNIHADTQKLNDYINYLVLKLKIKFNRVRPFILSHKYNINIFIVALDTIFTPSYPSGHSASGRFFYRYFSDNDPINEPKYFALMNNITLARLLAGVHYKSDCDIAIIIADLLYDKLKEFSLL